LDFGPFLIYPEEGEKKKMADEKVFNPPSDFSNNAWIKNMDQYKKLFVN